MEKTELGLRFTYHPPKDGQPAKYTALRDAAMAFAGLISDLVPENREQALAITAIEEAVMWANASIARGLRDQKALLREQLSPDQVEDIKRTILGVCLHQPPHGDVDSFIDAVSNLVLKRFNEMAAKEGTITSGV